MKITNIILIVLSISTLAFAKKNLNAAKAEKRDIIGEVFNNSDVGKKAVAYGKAQSNYYNDSPKDFISPETVPLLPDDVPKPNPGPLEPSDEVPTPHFYYDGGMKLNVVNIKCDIYATKSDCFHTSGCGWCGSTQSCILGNNFGPQQPCVKASYIYSQPIPNFNPQTRVINERVGGVSAHIISNPL